MLRDDIAKYTELSGNDGEHTAIGIIGAYLDGYDKGKEERPWGKWVISEIRCPNCLEYFNTDCYSTEELKKCPNCGADMRKEAENE